MADTTFVDNSTVIVASWLNDINNTVYTGLGGEQTASGIRTHLGLGTAALTNTGTSAGNTVVLDGTAKLPAVDGSQLTNITATIVDVTSATGTLPVLHGGTDATTASGARTNLGSTTVGDAVFTAATVAAAQQAMDVEVGVDVQAYDVDTAKTDVAQNWTATQTLGAGVSLIFEGATADDYEGTLSSADVTADRTWTLPDKSGTVAMTSDISSSGITLGTAVSLTTQTAIDYTGLPAGIKRLTISFQGVSTNGTDRWLVQIGNTTFTTTGYVGHANSGAGVSANSSGFEINNNVAAANNYGGQVVITKVDTNTYAQSGVIASQTTANSLSTSGGSIALASELERVRITTASGANQFDAGKINIAYE